jgi:integrase-like protein
LDRNELDALLVAAGLGSPVEHALISLLALNGLRVPEATGADIEHLGPERGHRTVTITRKGGKVVTIPLAPRTARAMDLAIGERTDGPVFLAADGRRLDRHGAGGIVGKVVTPHALRHAFITAALDAGVPLRDVQEAASHADPRTTMRYHRARGSLDRHATYRGRLRRRCRPVIHEGWELFRLAAQGRRRRATGSAGVAEDPGRRGIAPKRCDRVAGVKSHRVTVQRLPGAFRPLRIILHRAAVGTGGLGTPSTRVAFTRAGAAALVSRPGKRPAGPQVLGEGSCSPHLAHASGKSAAVPGARAAVCRGDEEGPWTVSCLHMTALSLSLRGFAKR